MTPRVSSLLFLCAALATAACVGPVQSGLPPLVQGCSQDSDCPPLFLCGNGSCEKWLCNSSCDCPTPNGFGCFQGGSDGGDVQIGVETDGTAGGGLTCGADAGMDASFNAVPSFCFCARGASPDLPDAGC